MKKIFKGLYKTLVLIVLVVLILVTIIQIMTINSNEPTSIFGHYYSQVISPSMEKTVMTGDYIIFKKFDEYKEGDIVVFKADNKLIVHRIIDDTNEEGFITKGDNNPNDDISTFGYIKDNQIVGKMVFKTGLLGLGKIFLNNKNIIIFTAMILIALLLFKQVIDVFKIITKNN